MTAETKIPNTVEARYNYGYIWAICIVASLGGLLFGYDWVVISAGADNFYEKYFALTSPWLIGWAKGCALVGCLLGALASGALSDRFGRKRLLILSALLFAVSSVGTGLAGSIRTFILWRMAGGMAIGLASNLSPMYIAEVAPAAIRGRLVAVNQLTIVLGIVLAQLVNFLIAEKVPDGFTADRIRESWNGQYGWRWMFGVTAVPSMLFFLGMFFVPESPRWLAKRGLRERARGVLARIGGEPYAEGAVADIEETLRQESEKVDFGALLEPRLRPILILGIGLAVLQQWCGINVIFYYAKDVFADAGSKADDTFLQIVYIGLTNLAFTFVGMAAVDRWGRRPLMLFGFMGLAAIYILMGSGFMAGVKGLPIVGLVLLAIACYACTLAPVTWVVLAEIFPNRIRGAALSVAVFSLWSACTVLTVTFDPLRKAVGSACTFWIYAAICVTGWAFIRAKLPETKGKTLEDLERELEGNEGPTHP